MPKFCKDCRFFSPPKMGELVEGQMPSIEFGKCHHEKAVKTDTDYFVSGNEKSKVYYYAAAMRGGPDCGHDAKLFLPDLAAA